MIKRWLLLILIVGPILYFLAFGLTRDPSLLPSALIGKKIPDLALENLDGKQVSLSSFSGKSLVINFWSTWCGPCMYEHPLLLRASKEYGGKNILFLGIAYQDDKEEVKAFLKENGEPFTVLLDPKGQAAIQFGVGGVPETFFADTAGIIRAKHSGVLTPEVLDAKLGLIDAGER